MHQITSPITIRYLEIEHPASGFGLCHARNAGLHIATGAIVGYLDDDNELSPTFVSTITSLFKTYPHLRCLIPQQRRRRDVVQDGEIVKQGTPFLSPSPHATVWDLVVQKELFDSNGFVHYRHDAPQWNPAYKIFCDYEYFLSCVGQFGIEAFFFAPTPEITYIQTSQGVIGQSTYQEWCLELQSIIDNSQRYPILTASALAALNSAIATWQKKHTQHHSIAAFSTSTPNTI